MLRLLLAALIGAAWVAGAESLSAQPAAPPAIDTVRARRLFLEAAAVTAADGGRLWGRSLAGPLLFVDPVTRTVVTDSADTEGRLTPWGTYYTGQLPPSENAANTAFRWAGRTWAMIMWPPTADSLQRRVLFAHELWHRIQGDLGLPSTAPDNGHLGTRDGRLWLRLEGRALRRAVDTPDADRTRAIGDALAFRRRRQARFPGADSTERLLEMHEGLAEYTGVVLATPSGEGRNALVISRLAALDTTTHFERDFAYQTGPAYGVLLDELAPGWRAALTGGDDLSRLLERALGGEPSSAKSATVRAKGYGYTTVRRDEDARDRRRRAKVAALRARFATGPLLELPLREMKLGFDPGQVEALDSLGSVYGKLRLSDRWGVLECDASGGLVTSDWSRVVVPAPAATTGRRLTGPGWVLDLAPSWHIAPGRRRGDWTVVEEP
jgi:hypothetical protein